jgi:hypothetical protein
VAVSGPSSQRSINIATGRYNIPHIWLILLIREPQQAFENDSHGTRANIDIKAIQSKPRRHPIPGENIHLTSPEPIDFRLIGQILMPDIVASSCALSITGSALFFPCVLSSYRFSVCRGVCPFYETLRRRVHRLAVAGERAPVVGTRGGVDGFAIFCFFEAAGAKLFLSFNGETAAFLELKIWF